VRTEDIDEKYHDILLETYYFLDNGKGVIDSSELSESVYGDKDRYSYTEYFTYTVSGNTVSIKRDTFSSAIPFTFNTTSLVGSGGYVLAAQELTAEDKERIAQAIYETMDDDERLDFSLGFINEEKGLKLATESKYKYFSIITWGISVKASEHVYSRGIESIRADFKIEGGQFCSGGNSCQLNMFISEDKNQIEVTGPLEFYRDADAKLIVKIYEYDRKQKKEVYINTFEFKYTNNPNIGGEPTESDSNGGENKDDTGDGNGVGSGGGSTSDDDSQYRGSINGHEWVDLGLPSGTKWATMNVGATSETDPGGYFMWGSISPGMSEWSFSVYKHPLYDESVGEWIRYLHSDYSSLLYADDAAYQNWGNSWCMPTYKQCKELIDYCSITYFKDKKYCEFQGPNRQTLKVPLGGHSCSEYKNKRFYLWSNELSDEKNCSRAYSIEGSSDNQSTVVEGSLRSLGLNIRAVVR